MGIVGAGKDKGPATVLCICRLLFQDQLDSSPGRAWCRQTFSPFWRQAWSRGTSKHLKKNIARAAETARADPAFLPDALPHLRFPFGRHPCQVDSGDFVQPASAVSLQVWGSAHLTAVPQRSKSTDFQQVQARHK